MAEWYRADTAQVIRDLRTDPERGLTSDEAARRLAETGPNELVESGGRGPWRILLEQFRGPMILLLVAAAIVSLVLGEWIDSVAILTIILLNAALGFFQDYRAEQAMAALKQMAVPTVKVRRDGSTREVSSREIVPGDLILLEAGNIVSADARLIHSASVRAQEAALTGESEPVEKEVEAIDRDDLSLGDRVNMVYMGTAITYGHGRAVVTETGMRTELGHIARMLQSVEQESTPLERHLAQLGRGLAVAAIGIVVAFFVLGLLRGEEWKVMFLTAMSLAVAAVPEGLPAVATVTLAIGARRMLRRKALIRKLPAVETLGSVTVICSDKTGTLTENRMTVTAIEVAGQPFSLTPNSTGNEVTASASIAEEIARRPLAALLLAAGALCNDAELEIESEDQGKQTGNATKAGPRVVGEPTETALVVAAAKAGLPKPRLERQMPRVAEAPFDSTRKRMSTAHRLEQTDGASQDLAVAALADAIVQLGTNGDAQFLICAKGAIDSLSKVSSRIVLESGIAPFDERARNVLGKSHDELAARGMRVLAIACRTSIEEPDDHEENLERDLTLLGLVAIIDPPRAEAATAVTRCREAGIRPMMITGDHRLTALEIARQLGISVDDRVATGETLARATPEELDKIVATTSVFARVSPEHKLRIVESLQRQGHIVAMTGDGVNDAPALKRANIGVAMGITGTDVSKEAADMVLLDDNFASIVRAVEQGRIIYDNIRKFIKYLLASNVGEIVVMAAAPVVGMPLPLLPLQILWVNLVTDGLPGLALAVEKAESDTMRRPPHSPTESFFARGLGRDILWIGVVLGIITLAAAYYYWDPAHPEDHRWQTIAFTVLTFSQMGNVLALRSAHDSIWRIGPFSNRPLLAAVACTILLHTMIVYVPWFQQIFKTTALGLPEFIFCGVVSSAVFVLVEIAKWISRKWQP
ncbi:MAG: cation-translocating P-type ATPase [Pirellulales bacterium]|nr:cation-translocating P-type ATPase [Pirellulales bacterium]